MSISVGQSSNGYRINDHKNTITINSTDEENKTLIKLNANGNIIQDETYIQIGPEIKFGSSNNIFVIKDNSDQNLLNLDNNIITFNQEIFFQNNVNILDNIYINNDVTHFYKDVHFHLEQNEIISVNNDLIQIHNDHIHTKNLISSHLQVDHSIKTNRIYPISSNIIIEGLLLEDYRALNGTFKNNMIIDYSQLGNSIPENVTSISINKLQNSCNFINLYEENNKKFAINHNGYIQIGDINNNIPININSIEDNIIKINDVFNVNKIGGLSLGKIKDNKSLLNIHRNDTNIQNNILNESLSTFSMDYNPLNNYITSNIENLPFYSSNLVFVINKYNDSTLNLSIELCNVNPEHNVQWISNDFTNITYQNTLNKEIGLILRWNLINYNDYNFHYFDLIQNSDLIINSSNIRLITGLWYTNKNDMETQMNELITNTSLTNSNYELIKINRTEAINEYFAEFDNYNLNIELNIIIEKTNYTPIIQYINTIPQLQSPPNFIDFQSNNELIGYIDANGLFEINDMKIINNTELNNVSIQKLTDDIDFNNYNQTNVKNIDAKNIYIEDTIYIGDITISKNNGIVLGNASVENKINSIDISNLNSKYLKYNDESTSILNKLNIGSNLHTLNTIRENNSLYNIIIADESVYMQNGNITMNGLDSYMNINSYKIEYKQRNDSEIDEKNTFCLTTHFNNNVFSRNYNDLNLLTLGHNDFICIDTQKDDITIGIPTYFMNQGDNWYTLFNKRLNTNNYTTIYNEIETKLHPTSDSYLNHTATIYGGTRFADKRNYTLAEIRDDNETSTLRVYGNIKCSKARTIPDYSDPTSEKNIIFGDNNEALYVDGDAKVDGKIYSTGGVVSLSDRNVKTEIKIIQNSIEKIKQISGYTYYRTDLHKNDTGLIAQEVEQIFPEVIEENNKLKSISYGNLTGLLVEAIKNIDNRLEKIEKLLI